MDNNQYIRLEKIVQYLVVIKRHVQGYFPALRDADHADVRLYHVLVTTQPVYSLLVTKIDPLKQ